MDLESIKSAFNSAVDSFKDKAAFISNKVEQTVSDIAQNISESSIFTPETNNVTSLKKNDFNNFASEFYNIADDYSGLSSTDKMQKFIDENINSDNIVNFLNSYENFKHDDSSIIDTISSEILSSSDKRKKILSAIMENLSDTARKFGVNENDILNANNSFEKFNSFGLINSSGMETSLNYLKNLIIEKNPTLAPKISKDDMSFESKMILDGKLGLHDVSDLAKNYDTINNEINGARLDYSLNNWILQSEGNVIQIKTDNNIVSEEWAHEHPNIDKSAVVTEDVKQSIIDAVQVMNEHELEIPHKIYLTKMFDDEKTYGIYSRYSDTNAIFINANALNDLDFLKHTIYHESAHLADFKNRGQGSLSLSESKNVFISPMRNLDETIKFQGDSIEKKKIYAIICNYALSNPQEFVAEVSALITSGKIFQTRNGYAVNFDENGIYTNSCGKKLFVFQPENQEMNDKISNQNDIDFVYENFDDFQADLNKIMKLYNYLTDGRITIPCFED